MSHFRSVETRDIIAYAREKGFVCEPGSKHTRLRHPVTNAFAMVPRGRRSQTPHVACAIYKTLDGDQRVQNKARSTGKYAGVAGSRSTEDHNQV